MPNDPDNVHHLRGRGPWVNRAFRERIRSRTRAEVHPWMVPLLERRARSGWETRPLTEEAWEYLMLHARSGEVDDLMSRLWDGETVDVGHPTQLRPLLGDSPWVATPFGGESLGPEVVSGKGSVLMDLYRKGCPVPDLVVLNRNVASLGEEDRTQALKQALDALERITGRHLGAGGNPLVLALRSAMPSYLPGLMPTFLNVGVCENSLPGLAERFGQDVAERMFLHNLQNMAAQAGIGEKVQEETLGREGRHRLLLSLTDQLRQVQPELLRDPAAQVAFLVGRIYAFYHEHRDLILTFTRGQIQWPSVILQEMVITVGPGQNYPGVLYTRHPRTGRGGFLEVRNDIFGESIMTGELAPETLEFEQPETLRDNWPALYHFLPASHRLEQYLQAPATVEFAATSRGSVTALGILQLNAGDLTGRATLVSSMCLMDERVIPPARVTELVKPYHLRQIISATIDQGSFAQLDFLSRGVSILPRSAVSARIFFSSARALEAKRSGDKVCFCKQSFAPSDTLVMGEMDAILSLTPAAIHVVTACRGFGIPALLNLEQHGVRLLQTRTERVLISERGIEVREGDWVTLSSRRQSVYLGEARFTPARFQKYLAGEQFPLLDREAMVFADMAQAYGRYQDLLNDPGLEDVIGLEELVKRIRNDYRQDLVRAEDLVRRWYQVHGDYYVREVLKSEMGTHLEQHTIYNLLGEAQKQDFYRRAIVQCRRGGVSGLSAGSFMLGRFLSQPQTVGFWKGMDPGEIAFMLNEWVLFEKYMKVLDSVGERKLNRARQQILAEGFGQVTLGAGDAKLFISLKIAGVDRRLVRAALDGESDPETERLLDILDQPYGFFFNYHAPWSLSALEEICRREGLSIPDPKDR